MPRPNRPEVEQFILAKIEAHPRDITALVAGTFEMSRQAAHRQVAKLVETGALQATGSTRNREYKLRVLAEIERKFSLEGKLQEDVIWREMMLPALVGVRPSVLAICEYGFTEILNNAIDHSRGTSVRVHLRRTAQAIRIEIEDDGVGIFKKIRGAMNFETVQQAILELQKGKLTTDPARHSGQGLFFTGKAFDLTIVVSEGIGYTLVSGQPEPVISYSIEDSPSIPPGTRVEMAINPRSTKTLKEVFDDFSGGEDYAFRRTSIPMRLAVTEGENLMSRSQAKRILSRLENFEEAELNFAGIEQIGLAFADELFRVFAIANPSVKLVAVNTSEEVERMIRRSRAELNKEKPHD